VRLTGLRRLAVDEPAPEAFVPLWPLADFVSANVSKQGTWGPRER
jgi:hypothetical protein